MSAENTHGKFGMYLCGYRKSNLQTTFVWPPCIFTRFYLFLLHTPSALFLICNFPYCSSFTTISLVNYIQCQAIHFLLFRNWNYLGSTLHTLFEGLFYFRNFNYYLESRGSITLNFTDDNPLHFKIHNQVTLKMSETVLNSSHPPYLNWILFRD